MDPSTASKAVRRLEHAIARVLFASRWLLMPIYLGLAFLLVLLVFRFTMEFAHIAVRSFSGTEAEFMLGVLSLVELALTGSLIVIVIFSGYENFVARIDPKDHPNWPPWLATIDFSGLKLKLLASVVVISGIELLKQFMAIKSVSDRDLMWTAGIHLVFVTSGLLLALSDRIAGPGHAPAGNMPEAPKQRERI